MLLFAELPDRLHAQVLGPMGGPRLIVDAGRGRAAVVLVGERTAYRGAMPPDGSLAFLGLDVRLEDLLGALLLGRADGAAPPFRRVPESGPGLPEQFRIETPTGSLDLTRLRFVRGDPDSSVATGAVPQGFRVLPLEELATGNGVFLEEAGEDGP